MNQYFKKQIIIALVWIIVLAIIVFVIYSIFSGTKKETCFDGIQNQTETGIDCGGPCKECEQIEAIKILNQAFIPTVDNNYDLVAQIKNPNIYLGGEILNYEFDLYDNNDQLIGTKTGNTYILPQETKYIVEPRIFSEKIVSKMEFKIQNVSWKKLSAISNLEIRTKNIAYQKFDTNSKFVGFVENKTSYDLGTIEVVGILFDVNNKIIAVSKTLMNTVLMNETRGFEMNWPYQIPSEVKSFDARAYTNIFLDENFIKTQDNSSSVE